MRLTLSDVSEERTRLKYRARQRRAILVCVGVLIVSLAAAVLVSSLFLTAMKVTGTSMEPTIMSGDVVILLHKTNYKNGELVGFYCQNKILLKRIIGVAGDTVDMLGDGTVLLNGEALSEPYVTDMSRGEGDAEFPLTVPEGAVFVLGDNRTDSVDSRQTAVGFISTEEIVGEIVFRMLPLGSIGTVR